MLHPEYSSFTPASPGRLCSAREINLFDLLGFKPAPEPKKAKVLTNVLQPEELCKGHEANSAFLFKALPQHQSGWHKIKAIRDLPSRDTVVWPIKDGKMECE